jgi:hypothetical protein
MTEEDRPDTVDMTPTIYGEAHAMATGTVAEPEYHENMDSETLETVKNKIRQAVTDRFVKPVVIRRIMHKIVNSDAYNVTQEDMDQLTDEVLGNPPDERVKEALED